MRIHARFIPEAEDLVLKRYPPAKKLLNQSLEDRLCLMKVVRLLQKENERRAQHAPLLILDRTELDTLVYCGGVYEAIEHKAERWSRISQEIGAMENVDAVLFFRTFLHPGLADKREYLICNPERKQIYLTLQDQLYRIWQEYCTINSVPIVEVRPYENIKEKFLCVYEELKRTPQENGRRVAFTGGSHSGKTTIIRYLRSYLPKI